MIILNEKEWVEEAMQNSDLGSKPFYTLSRVCRYYMDRGYDLDNSRAKTEGFLIQCDPRASMVLWNNCIENAVKNALKHPLIQIESITISKTEMDKISQLNGIQMKKLAFTLLCIAKYWNMVNADNNNWVNSKDSEIMRIANVSATISKQNDMYHKLYELGLVRFSKKVDSLNTCVTFIDSGEPFIYVSDFRNLGYQYMKAIGTDVFECQNCGIVMSNRLKSKYTTRKYCPDCAFAIKLKKDAEFSARAREKKKMKDACTS